MSDNPSADQPVDSRPLLSKQPAASDQMVQIGRRMIANIVADTTDVRGSTYMGEGGVFTDQDRFEREREVLFRRTPQIIVLGRRGRRCR